MLVAIYGSKNYTTTNWIKKLKCLEFLNLKRQGQQPLSCQISFLRAIAIC